MSIDKKIMAAALALGAVLLVAGCDEDKSKSTADDKSSATDTVKDAATAAGEKAKEAAEAVKDAATAAGEKAKEAAEAVKDAASEAAAKIEEKMAEPSAPPATTEPEKTAEAPAAPAAEPAAPAETPAATEEAKTETPAATEAAPAPEAASGSEPDNDPTNPDNAAVRAMAKELGLEWKDGRYRDKDGHPAPVVTKDYKVDWATWQGFRRYHDACHVCHGPNAGGSTFAPSLADSLKTMDYETFFGTVVGGRVTDRAGTKYVMPAFGEDKNIMCYLDDIYSYIKARSTGAMPPGRPAAREDISDESRKAGTECFGEDQTGGGAK